MPLVNININGKDIQAENGLTILEAALANNIHIPTLCNDERVKIYASCGICLVEPESSPRLLRACSTTIAEGMKIKTDTERVLNTRKAALELLFSDHKGDCRPPCVLSCPGQTDCQGYIGLIANGQYREAVELMKERLPLPSSIGRVCPHPCETACRRELVEDPVSIAHLKYFASDKFLDFSTDLSMDLSTNEAAEIAHNTGKNVAIAGGGPGGLTAAYFLRKHGHNVSLYDAMPKMGGMLRYGIPEYRLPKDILDREISSIEKMGVKFINNMSIGKDISLEELRKNNDALLVAIGAWSSSKLGCPGEDLDGVLGGIDFLRDVALDKKPEIGSRVAIVGGGNTAMDACRTAIRLGAANVYLVYRRSRDEMPAEEIEIVEAEEEGVIFRFLTNPIEITGKNGKVSALRLQKMKLGDPDASGRRSPVPIAGEEEMLDLDTVIIAIGQGTRIDGFEDLKLSARKTIIADENNFKTNLDGVFAIGDASNKGADIAISAIGEARKAAEIIDAYLNGKDICSTESYLVKTDPKADYFSDREKISRKKMKHLNPSERKNNFCEVNLGYSEEDAIAEAKRCLECGCMDYFECSLINISRELRIDPSKYINETPATEASASAEKSLPVINDHPYIDRNPDKCILCGLCLRICDELMGVAALGLVDRGFDTMVQPAFDSSLNDSGCISCGQCVSLCPTGALTEKISLYKPVPLNEDFVQTICSFCSVGCRVKLTFRGSMILRCLPDNSENREEILCKKGRFGFMDLPLTGKILKPLVDKKETDHENACKIINKKMKDIIAKHGRESAAISVSGKMTNEEIALAREYADSLGIGIYSFGLSKDLHDAGKTGSFEELEKAEFILLAANDIMESHPIAGIHIRKAVQNGARLILVSDCNGGLASEWCHEQFTFKEIDKALSLYKNSAKANNNKSFFVYVQNDLTESSIPLLTDLVSAGSNFLALVPEANSRGLMDLNVSPAGDLIEKLNSKTLKALIVFGEDPAGTEPVASKPVGITPNAEGAVAQRASAESAADLSGLDFLCASGTNENKTTDIASIVLPWAGFAEVSGTYTDTTGRRQKLNNAFSPKLTNADIIKCLKETLHNPGNSGQGGGVK